LATALLILHGLCAVTLLGAITHQTLAAWAPSTPRGASFFGRFRRVPPAGFSNAVVVLYIIAAALGAYVYLDFRVQIRPAMEQHRHWTALGFFELKEHFVAIGLGLLPAYWMYWRPGSTEPRRIRAVLTALLAIIAWFGFLVGHVLNDIRGFGW